MTIGQRDMPLYKELFIRTIWSLDYYTPSPCWESMLFAMHLITGCSGSISSVLRRDVSFSMPGQVLTYSRIGTESPAQLNA